MKSLLALALFLCVAVSAQCLDLTLNNGRVCKDVQILNWTADGVDIVSHQDDDITVFRHIRYNELSPDSLKSFEGKYDARKADDCLTSMRDLHLRAVSKNNVAYTEWLKLAGDGSKIAYPVPSADRMRIVFKATKSLAHGAIGWASTDGMDENDNASHFGKIYIHGLELTEGNEWIGTVYLTNKFMSDRNETCPCYVTNKDDVAKMNKRAQ